MSSLKRITVVGGGLAGLTLGISLRHKGVPVTIWEAGHYPRHRVCGEFISGRGQEVLARLGLQEAFAQAGSVAARNAAFFFGRRSSPPRALPAPAQCLSRFEMDALLAKRFRALGGELREQERWRETHCGEGVVRASGRRVQPVENGWRWFGLKVHARNVTLVADLEMHCFRNGYVGICRLKDGEVNVCGLFRRPVAKEDSSPHVGLDLLRGEPGTVLRERLERAAFDEKSFSAVAGLSLERRSAAAQTECCIGDALTMVPPVTGNGMSMAFEAAEIALEPLLAYSQGKIPWAEAQQAVARACDSAFARRLAWARWLQYLMFAPALQGSLARFALHSGRVWKTLFQRTR